ncbi:MAG: 3-phosphoshikimate 1-carboxyvinyltransferase [Spirochaetaceae bacterium]|nr:3-phosphoshikimate 1-carboxyvinyltransferase [Spirochaetaceae bacterium]
MEALEVAPAAGPVSGTVTVPGSKSLTNRALVVAALATGRSTLGGAQFSDDTEACMDGLMRLGIGIESDPAHARIAVEGAGGTIPADVAELDVRYSGTTARFLTAVAAAGRGVYRFDGAQRMRERPMGDLPAVLAAAGARFRFSGEPGHLPFEIEAAGLPAGRIEMSAAHSSQPVSALLLCAPAAAGATTIVVDGPVPSEPFIDLSVRVMRDFGVEVGRPRLGVFEIGAEAGYRGRDYEVEPDATNASYFLAAAAVTGGSVCVRGLAADSSQGDIACADILRRMGCDLREDAEGITVTGPERLRGVDVDLNAVSDLTPTFAAIAPFADAPVTIRNVAHIRVQETDRIAALTTELRRLGATVEERPDGLRIEPSRLAPAAIRTYQDHRMAMAFAVTGLRVPGLTILDPGCAAKTFPDFFDRFAALTVGS